MESKKKEKKDGILNLAFNRWQYNRPKYVGYLSEAIRACAPQTEAEWQKYYMEEVPKKHVPSNWVRLGSTMEEHLQCLGQRLYVKISEQLKSELEEITEEDCIAYIRKVVIERTYRGYLTEKQTVYGILQSYIQQNGINLPIRPAPQKWGGSYNVDFYIPIQEDYPKGKLFVGIQIKPVTYEQFQDASKWHEWMRESHERFRRDFGGKVFVIFSHSKGQKKDIANETVLKEIIAEIKLLMEKASD